MSDINIVYYTYINIHTNYMIIITGQLDDLINSEILTHSKLFIVICYQNIEKKIIDEIEYSIKNKLDNKCANYEYELSFINENMFEYHGIKKLYDLALNEPDKIYLYFHGKGMFNQSNGNNKWHSRTIENIILTRSHVNIWRKTLNLFNTNSEIIAAGMFPASNLVFYNFFYARGNFLISCGPPEKTSNRYYYECWLPHGNFNLGKIYNLYENNFNYYNNNGIAKDNNNVVHNFYTFINSNITNID